MSGEDDSLCRLALIPSVVDCDQSKQWGVRLQGELDRHDGDFIMLHCKAVQ